MAAAGNPGDPRPRSTRGAARHDPAVPELLGDPCRRAQGASARHGHSGPGRGGGVPMSVVGGPGDVAGDALRAQSPAASPPALVALRSPGGTALIAATVLASMVGFLDANVINVAVP